MPVCCGTAVAQPLPRPLQRDRTGFEESGEVPGAIGTTPTAWPSCPAAFGDRTISDIVERLGTCPNGTCPNGNALPEELEPEGAAAVAAWPDLPLAIRAGERNAQRHHARHMAHQRRESAAGHWG